MAHPTIPSRLLAALLSINASTPRTIIPPAVSGSAALSRRASVAIIIRFRPNSSSPLSSSPSTLPSSPGAVGTASSSPSSTPSGNTSPLPTPSIPPAARSVSSQLHEFFEQPWVKWGSTAEILFIKRASRGTDRWSGHVAFPGGRQEPEDEDGRYTAMRETWEEVGLDLAEKEWLAVGQLDDREITTSLGKRLLMILSPHVFLYTAPTTPVPELQETEVASAHWIPIQLLHPPQARHGQVAIDISTRLAPRNAAARFLLRHLVGSMHFRCILLPNEPVAIGQITPPPPSGVQPELKLWGLTLGMTLDLLSSMSVPSSPSDKANLSTYPHAVSALDDAPLGDASTMSPFAPSMASIFPTFSFPDINFLIWLFGWRYRRLLAHSRNPSIGGQKVERDARVNWAGMSLGLYYAAVRRALLVACLIRAFAAAGAVGWFGWWITKKRRSLVLL